MKYVQFSKREEVYKTIHITAFFVQKMNNTHVNICIEKWYQSSTALKSKVREGLFPFSIIQFLSKFNEYVLLLKTEKHMKNQFNLNKISWWWPIITSAVGSPISTLSTSMWGWPLTSGDTFLCGQYNQPRKGPESTRQTSPTCSLFSPSIYPRTCCPCLLRLGFPMAFKMIILMWWVCCLF